MRRPLMSFVALALAQLCAVPAQAEECDESSECPAGKVCQHHECIDVVPECAEFCEAMSPCFSSSTECEGGGVMEIGTDGGEVSAVEIIEEWEDCHETEDLDAKLLDDCLGDCSEAKGDAESWQRISTLMDCMKEADYSCDAKEICAGEADFGGSGGAGYYDPDAYSSGDGKSIGLNEEVQSGADKSEKGDSGGKSCSMVDSGTAPGCSGAWILLGVAAGILLVRRSRAALQGGPHRRPV